MPSDFRWHSFLVSAGYLPDTGLQEVTNPSALSFVEIPVKTALDTTPVPTVPAAMTPVAVIRSGRLTLELSNDISESLLCRLLQGVLHA